MLSCLRNTRIHKLNYNASSENTPLCRCHTKNVSIHLATLCFLLRHFQLMLIFVVVVVVVVAIVVSFTSDQRASYLTAEVQRVEKECHRAQSDLKHSRETCLTLENQLKAVTSELVAALSSMQGCVCHISVCTHTALNQIVTAHWMESWNCCLVDHTFQVRACLF